MPNTPQNNFKDQAAENQKVHDQLEQNSDIANPDFDKDTGGALDKLLEDQQKKADEEAAAAAGDKPDVTPKDDDKPADTDDDKPADTDDDDDDDRPADTDDDKPADTDDVDPFADAPKLPDGASPKSHEAFAHVKAAASAKYKEYETRLAELESKLQEAEDKLKDPVPAETKQEIEDLRKFRAKLDIEADPEFKKTNVDISRTEEFIYAQLLKSPNIDDSIISDIKKLGGPTKVKMDKILAAVDDPTIKRIVEGKLADIEQLKFNQEQAVRKAKENISAYVQERQEAYQKAAVAHRTDTTKLYQEFMGRFDWAAPRQPKAGAKPEELKAIEEHNKFLKDVNAELDEALRDDSPKMRATLMTGMANLFWLQRVHKSVNAENDRLKKENAELQKKLDRFKKASVGRLKDSAAPAPGQSPAPKQDDSELFTRKTGDALDNLRQQVIQERARAHV